jgi:solute carrier family 25 citrate transporter 1/solute carrier family 25 2-oxodicarboxylate transporter 21
MCSSLLSSPAELVMTLQQQTGHSITSTIRNVTLTHGVSRLYRAFPLTCVRECVWTASYLALGPLLGGFLHDTFPATFGSRDAGTLSQRASAAIGGSIGAGLVAVVTTQPVDTLKTIMQGNALDRGSSASASTTISEARRLWTQGGLRALYKGTLPRGLRLIGAVFILSESKRVLEDQCRSVL